MLRAPFQIGSILSVEPKSVQFDLVRFRPLISIQLDGCEILPVNSIDFIPFDLVQIIQSSQTQFANAQSYNPAIVARFTRWYSYSGDRLPLLIEGASRQSLLGEESWGAARPLMGKASQKSKQRAAP